MKPASLALLAAVLIVGCAPRAASIAPSHVSTAYYSGWSCERLLDEHAKVTDTLIHANAAQDRASNRDTLTVIFLGAPLSAGGIKGEVARLKGEEIAISRSLMYGGCINTVRSSPKPPQRIVEQTITNNPAPFFDDAWNACQRKENRVTIQCIANQGVQVSQNDWERCRILPEHKVSRDCVWNKVQ